jgi:hypothetical protein
MNTSLIFLASIVQQGYADYVADLWRSFYAQCCGCVGVIVFILGVAGLWRIFVKAGENGWAAIIPFYNIWVLLRVVGRPGWWLILLLIPIVQIVAWIIVSIELAKAFDKGFGYALGIFLFPYFFFLILGFSESKYFGPGGPATA